MSALRKDIAIAKVPFCIEHIDKSLAEGPVILFAHHHDVIDKMKESFGHAVTITGMTSLDDRQKAVDDFQSGKSNLFIGNILAAGVGITLTKSSHVVFAEMSWVPADMSQCEDRCILEGEPVLTPTGWVPIENIKVGDLVIAGDGKPHRVLDAWSRLARGAKAADSKDIAEIEVLGWHRPLRLTTAPRACRVGSLLRRNLPNTALRTEPIDVLLSRLSSCEHSAKLASITYASTRKTTPLKCRAEQYWLCPHACSRA